MDRIAGEHPGKTVCIATHGCAIRNFLCYAGGKPIEELNSVEWCDNTAVSVVEYDDSFVPHIVSQNDASHLNRRFPPLKNRIGGDLKRRKAARDDHPGNRFGQGPYRRGGMRPGGMLASPLCVIQEHNRERLIEKIVKFSNERRAEQIALGLPKNMDGSEGGKRPKRPGIWSASARKDRPAGSLCDERGTTVTAHGYLNRDRCQGEKRKAVVDSVAAVIILQNYLDYRRNCL